MNEPADAAQTGLQAWYKRVEKAIRAVDPDHILFLDGNTYAMDFTAFDEVLPNCVYSIHDYATMGFPAGQPYTGTAEQKEILLKSYNRKVEFMKARGVPVRVLKYLLCREGIEDKSKNIMATDTNLGS